MSIAVDLHLFCIDNYIDSRSDLSVQNDRYRISLAVKGGPRLIQLGRNIIILSQDLAHLSNIRQQPFARINAALTELQRAVRYWFVIALNIDPYIVNL